MVVEKKPGFNSRVFFFTNKKLMRVIKTKPVFKRFGSSYSTQTNKKAGGL